MQTLKEQFNTREKISVKIDLKDRNGHPVKAILTVRCTNTNRQENDNQLLLPSYYYMYPMDIQYNSVDIYANKTLLNRTLNLVPVGLLRDTIMPLPHKPPITGYIVEASGGVTVKKQMMVFIARDTMSNFITTDSNGKFSPTPAQLVVTDGGTFSVIAGNIAKSKKETQPDLYAVNIINPMRFPMKHLEQPELHAFNNYQNRQDNADQVLTDPYEGKMMEAVIIKSKKARMYGDGIHGNNCNDYVCPANILNCPAHINDENNTMPEKGKIYRLHYTLGVREVLYRGCVEDSILRINTTRFFSGMNEEKLKNTEGLYFLSTLYWLPLLHVSGSANLEFYSSDLPGSYKIIVEGIAENGDMLHGEKDIQINKHQ